MKNEFDKLYQSLFKDYKHHIAIVRLLAKTRRGLNYEITAEKTKISSGGTLTNILKELEAAGFVQSFTPYGSKKSEKYFRVIDEYSLFFLKWIDPILSKGHYFTQSYWQTKINSPEWNAWAGYAFENVCMKHIEEIRDALGLTHIGCVVSNWRFISEAGSKLNGAQIDLLYDR